MKHLRPVLSCVCLLTLYSPRLVGQDTNQVDACLRYYSDTAQNKITVAQSSDFEQHLHRAFCDWAKGSNSSNSDASFGAYAKAISLSFNSDQTSRSEYEKRYCETDWADTSSINKYSFLSKFGDSKSQDNFNQCVNQGPWHVRVHNLDTCHFQATVSYTPEGRGLGYVTLQSDAQFINATCQGPTPAKGCRIGPDGITCPHLLPSKAVSFLDKCQRFGTSETFITLATDQPSIVIVHPPDASMPKRPPPPSEAIPQWDTLQQNFTIHFYRGVLSSVSPGTVDMHDYDFKDYGDNGPWKGWNWWSIGRLRLPDKDAVVVSVQRECAGPGCGYSYPVRKNIGYDADWDADRNSVVWYRRYQGDNVSDTTYTVAYKVPHRKTEAEKQYEQLLSVYEDKVRSICPYLSPNSH